MKRTIHGEALQYRPGGALAGLAMRRTFTARAAWCPTCQAEPNRKCQPTPADRDLADRLREAGVRGYTFHDHHARWERSTMLRQLAEQGPAVLYRLAVTDGRREPEQARIDSLPLFSGLAS